jgi:iron complex transport system substrate-binding protein
MKRATLLLIAIILLTGFRGITLAGSQPSIEGAARYGDYRRIISLAPSITEILFSLGLGDRVVGVTRYCTYPAAALTKAEVGGYYDPNYEEILRLKPDLVIMLREHDAAKRYLGNFHVNVLQVDHNTIGAIVQSITIIGQACGSSRAADSIVASISIIMARIRGKTANVRRPRVLVSVGRSLGSVNDLCIAGAGTYYDEMIRIAGGQNAFTKSEIAFPMLSLEGICRINPEIVIDMAPESGGKAVTDGAILAAWNRVGRIDAVRNGRVYLFRQDFAEIPGPRFIVILEHIAKVLHPELSWD